MSKNAIQIRKSKIQQQLVDQLKKTPVVEIACQKVDIGRNSYYRWRRESIKFRTACDKALEEGCALINDMAVSQLISAMKDGNLNATFYWLNHKHSDFANKLELNGNLEIQDHKLTKEQETNIKKALKLANLISSNNLKEIK